jgi:oligopeptidase B
VYAADHLGDQFLIMTNEDALNFKLMAAPIEDPRRENWRELIPHRDEVLIEEVHAFRNYLILMERQDGLKQVRIAGPDGIRDSRYVAFPEPAYDVTLAENPEFDTDTLRFTYSSLVTPDSVVDYGLETGEWTLRKQDQIPSGYDPGLYQAERIFALAPDGQQVPISLVYRKDLPRDGTNPCLLIGYGAYGSGYEPSFKAERLSLLERGFVFAIAHIRGGVELGRRWYEQGRRLNKKNTFTDFIACAEHLIATGYTSREKLAIFGRSAGGLLIGAAVTLRPDLFRAAIAPVPFVDVITTMSDPSIPLTVTEYDQWGNPADRSFFDYMLSYSPYDNLRPVPYPDLLLTTGLNDSRVAFWEPAKFAARLRAVKASDSLVLLKTDFESGHSGASGRYNALKDTALIYAFILDRLGVEMELSPESSEQL